MARYYTTPRGLERLKARLQDAREAYFRVCESNQEAAGAGDNCVWHDNFAYEENQRQMHQLSHRVKELEQVVASAEVVHPATQAPSRVQLGSQVRVWFEDEEREEVWFIAGYLDGDPKARRISYDSPLARAMIGKEEGDECEVKVEERVRRFEILELLPAPPEELF